MSTESERRAKSWDSGENEERIDEDQASSTAGCEMVEVATGRDFNALVRCFFDDEDGAGIASELYASYWLVLLPKSCVKKLQLC